MPDVTKNAPPAQHSSGRMTVSRREFARLIGITAVTFDKHKHKYPKPLDLGVSKELYSRAEVEAFLAGVRL